MAFHTRFDPLFEKYACNWNFTRAGRAFHFALPSKEAPSLTASAGPGHSSASRPACIRKLLIRMVEGCFV
jgi:hypothetical protein